MVYFLIFGVEGVAVLYVELPMIERALGNCGWCRGIDLHRELPHLDLLYSKVDEELR